VKRLELLVNPAHLGPHVRFGPLDPVGGLAEQAVDPFSGVVELSVVHGRASIADWLWSVSCGTIETVCSQD
jgi:hypothetical protein